MKIAENMRVGLRPERKRRNWQAGEPRGRLRNSQAVI